MSGLSIAPLSNNSASGDSLSGLLITDARKCKKTDSVADLKQGRTANDNTKPLYSTGWNGNLAVYEAQIIGAEMNRLYGPYPATANPRDAARAYGQARRRPAAMANRPRLQVEM